MHVVCGDLDEAMMDQKCINTSVPVYTNLELECNAEKKRESCERQVGMMGMHHFLDEVSAQSARNSTHQTGPNSVSVSRRWHCDVVGDDEKTLRSA